MCYSTQNTTWFKFVHIVDFTSKQTYFMNDLHKTACKANNQTLT